MYNNEDLNLFKSYLKTKKKVLFLATSNRWSGDSSPAKSTQLALDIASELKSVDIRVIDVSKLKIYDCEGNISSMKGNNCGVKDATLMDKQKNPSGCHRCWASINHPDDDLWKISLALLESDAVVFFVSTRWGQTNAIYQKLIERLSWIENRWATLGEDNIVKDIEAGMVLIGQNWNGPQVLQTQKNVLTFFGFKTPSQLSFSWQYTEDYNDETMKSYDQAPYKFQVDFGVLLKGLKKSKGSLSKYVNTYLDFFPKKDDAE
jgi:multimeric flavodoxin WrbA